MTVNKEQLTKEYIVLTEVLERLLETLPDDADELHPFQPVIDELALLIGDHRGRLYNHTPPTLITRKFNKLC